MKTLKIFGYALLAMTISMSYVACGGDDEKSDNNGGGGGEDNPATVVESEKAFFEETARLFINKVSANDFDQLRNLVKYVKQQRWEGDDVEDFFEDAIEACEEIGYDGYSYLLYRAANFCGEFSVSNGRWVVNKKGGDILKFTFNDQNGKTCVLQVKASGDPVKLSSELFNFSERHYVSLDYYPYYRYDVTRIEQSFMVPEKVEASLTQGGQTLVSAVVNTDINSSGQIDLTNDTYTISANATVCDYNVNVSRVRMENGKKAYAETTIKKGNETLLYVKANANGEVRLNGDEFKVRSAGEANVEVDILGRVQVKASVSDIDRLTDLVDALDDNRYKEDVFVNTLKDANSLIDAKVYFNGSSAPSCSAKLISSVKQGNSGMKYEPTPAIFFNDGTSYSFETYFDESYFKTVIKNFESLVKDFEDLIEDLDDDDDDNNDYTPYTRSY